MQANQLTPTARLFCGLMPESHYLSQKHITEGVMTEEMTDERVLELHRKGKSQNEMRKIFRASSRKVVAAIRRLKAAGKIKDVERFTFQGVPVSRQMYNNLQGIEQDYGKPFDVMITDYAHKGYKLMDIASELEIYLPLFYKLVNAKEYKQLLKTLKKNTQA